MRPAEWIIIPVPLLDPRPDATPEGRVVVDQTAVSSAPRAAAGATSGWRGLAGRRVAIPSPTRATAARTIIAAR